MASWGVDMSDDTWLMLIVFACVVAAIVCGIVAWGFEKRRENSDALAEKIEREYRDGNVE